MAAKGIDIPINSDTRGYDRAIKSGVIKPTEDAVEALEELGRAGDLDKLEREFREAQTASGKYEKQLAEVERAAKDAAKATRKIGDDADDGFRIAGEGAQGFKEEAVSNFSEVASSFDGSVGGAVDGVQGLLGGLATSLGPVGLGLAGLGAIGGAFYAQWEESARQTEERINGMYQDMAESGQSYLSESFVNQSIQDMIGDPKQWEEVKRISKETGMARGEVARALATEGEERERLLEISQREYRAALEGAAAEEDGFTYTSNALAAEANMWGNVIEKVNESGRELDQARERTDAYNQATAKTETVFYNAKTSVDAYSAAIRNTPREVFATAKLNTQQYDDWVRKLSNGHTVAVSPRVAENGRFYNP